MGHTLLLGNSAATERLRRDIAIAAKSDAKVLVLGETGVGKEIVAQSIHEQSARAARPFIPVNCSGIPETLLESELFGHVRGSFTGAYRDKPGVIRQAHRGTLFLDELGEMSLRMQATLLRFTESGEIHPVGADKPISPSDIRLITATNRDLRAQIEHGAFRQDLYYRLNVIEIRVVPLRERPEDVAVLLEHYLRQAAAAHSTSLPELTADAEDLLTEYTWPGNVRELKNVAERLVLGGWRRAVRADDLPDELRMNGTSRVVNASSQARPAAPLQADTATEPPATVTGLFARFAAGEDFWTVVYQPYKVRELSRRELTAVIDRGLQQTMGSYRGLLKVFNLGDTEYKRFHAFLYQQRCNLPAAAYRCRATKRREPNRTDAVSTPHAIAV
jgi:transcriptional regulator with PAS, ATPase and Fis domain